MAIAMGLHVRCGIEDNLWGRKGERLASVGQIEQLVRISRELYRPVATGKEAKEILQIGVQYQGPDETLSKLGWPPNRARGQQGTPLRHVA
jgi:hypothetical protein